MTDYNDGKWHGWNGGGCPVDPASACEFIDPTDDTQNDEPIVSFGPAEAHDWNCPVLFRVVKPAPPKPREWWLYGDAGDHIRVSDTKPTCRWDTVIHVREVLPE